MAATTTMATITIRVNREALSEIQYYLDVEETNLTKFVQGQIQQYIAWYRQTHPERVPRGLPVLVS